MKFFKIEEFKCRCGCTMPAELRTNMEALVRNVLDPAREAYAHPIYVTSGYRCPKHNAAVGGVKNSQHRVGEAADIHSGSPDENLKLAKLIVKLGNYDQLILYVPAGTMKPRFLHISWKRLGPNRHRILKKEDGKPGYSVVSPAAL